jgi:hypothetical protein
MFPNAQKEVAVCGSSSRSEFVLWIGVTLALSRPEFDGHPHGDFANFSSCQPSPSSERLTFQKNLKRSLCNFLATRAKNVSLLGHSRQKSQTLLSYSFAAFLGEWG